MRLLSACKHTCRACDARIVIHDLRGVGLVEASGEMRLSSCQPNGIGNSLAEWTCKVKLGVAGH